MVIDIGSMAALVGSLRTAGEITKAMVDLRDAAAVQNKVIELQGIILTAQSSALATQSNQLALLEQIRALEEKLAGIEGWSEEQEKYKLTDYGGGTFAYELDQPAFYGEPPHRICPQCYAEAKKSVLQFCWVTTSGQDHYECHSCKAEFNFGFRRS